MRPSVTLLGHIVSIAAMTALVSSAALAGGPYSGAAASKATRATRDVIEKICIVTYDPDPSVGGRKQLSSARCPAPASSSKQDACFCVVDVQGEPYAAAGKVAFALPGSGYSW